MSDPTLDLRIWKHSHAALERENAALRAALNEIRGTPEARFHTMLHALLERFPDPSPAAAPPVELRILEAIDALRAEPTVSVSEIRGGDDGIEGPVQSVDIFTEGPSWSLLVNVPGGCAGVTYSLTHDGKLTQSGSVGVKPQGTESELAALRAELARWKICENCGEPLEGPGICGRAVSERERGLEEMHEQTLTRAEAAESRLTALEETLSSLEQDVRAKLPSGDGRWEAVCDEVCRRLADELAALRARLTPPATKERPNE